MATTPTRHEAEKRPSTNWTRKRVDAQRKRLIQGAIHGTAIRPSNAGTVNECRSFLTRVNLARFRDAATASFETAHLALVRRLQRRLKRRGCSYEFGRAAKVVDLALRDLVQNHHTRGFYNLEGLDRDLHLPIDSQVDRGLRQKVGPDSRFPKPWPGMKGLKEEDYHAYQRIASEVARRRGITRIELDNEFWTRNPAQAPSAL